MPRVHEAHELKFVEIETMRSNIRTSISSNDCQPMRGDTTYDDRVVCMNNFKSEHGVRMTRPLVCCVSTSNCEQFTILLEMTKHLSGDNIKDVDKTCQYEYINMCYQASFARETLLVDKVWIHNLDCYQHKRRAIQYNQWDSH